MPAEFLCNLPKNLTTHLTHKLYSVFPKENKKCREEEKYPAAGSDREKTVGVSFRTVWEKVASEQHRGSFREDGNG